MMGCPYCHSERSSIDDGSIICEGCGAEFPVELQPHEIELARERIRMWPLEDRRALSRMTEGEARVIVLATALLDIRPDDSEGEE
jgi:hypothetical protein